MLNNEKIVNKFNAVYGASADPYGADMLEGFLDLDMLGITDEDMVKCIEDRIFTLPSDLYDAELIQNHLKGKDPEPVPAPQDNPFGMFEQMITGLVSQQALPLIQKMLKEASEQQRTEFDNWVKDNMQRITVPIEYKLPSGKTFDDVTHEKFDQVCKFVGLGLPVMLVGPAGTGKNHLCKQVADAFDLEFYFANAVTQEHKLTGFIDANGVYHETQFYKAFKDGGLFMFDELDASDPEVLVTFNAALANGYFDFPVGRVDAHKDFRVVAAANTTGNGASYEYVGRNQLDMATLNRFGMIRIDYSPRIENAMTTDNDLLDFIRSFRQACNEFGINHVASYRDITRCSLLSSALGRIESLRTGLIRNLEQDDINMLVHKFESKKDAWSMAFCDLAKEGC